MTTIARPYAIAAFEFASAKKTLPSWEGMLNDAALVVKQQGIIDLLDNPGVTADQLAELFCEILVEILDPEKRNFIYLLAKNRRLAVLPDIAKLFTDYRAEQEKSISVQITSAIPLNDIYQAKLIKNLTKRLQRQVSLQCEVDSALLGGVMVRAGDIVIDGSVRGKLNRLLESL